MDRIIRVVTAPTVEPVLVSEVSDHLRGPDTEHEPMLVKMIQASRERLERYLARAFVQQTRAVHYSAWPDGNVMEIPYPPIQSVTHIKYTDTDDTEYTWSSSEYSVDTYSEPGRVVLGYGESWPNESIHAPDYPIVVTYVCGYAASGTDYRANIPQAIKDAIKLDVEMMYDRPPDPYAATLRMVIENLLAPYRVWGN
jgi:uncharacterized phiE125 gp8 family phage protein